MIWKISKLCPLPNMSRINQSASTRGCSPPIRVSQASYASEDAGDLAWISAATDLPSGRRSPFSSARCFARRHACTRIVLQGEASQEVATVLEEHSGPSLRDRCRWDNSHTTDCRNELPRFATASRSQSGFSFHSPLFHITDDAGSPLYDGDSDVPEVWRADGPTPQPHDRRAILGM